MSVAADSSGALVLTCGDARWPRPGDVTGLPARPGREDLDAPLAGLDGRRLVVCGTDADLAAVVLRLLRTERLAAVPVGYVPASASSEVARLWGLPVDPTRAAAVALGSPGRAVPLLRDDAGGVLLGRGVVQPVNGVAYCDSELVLRGGAPWLQVQPDPQYGLAVRVGRARLRGVTRRSSSLPGLLGGRRRARTARGRAVQLGCEPTSVWRDGVESQTPERWTWYRHTEDWHLARP